MPDLTREQILSMPAGPEMDRLVAHRVTHYEPSWWDEGNGFWDGTPRYSTDPRAMMEVIENRRAAGWWLTMRWAGELEIPAWIASFYGRVDPWITGARADTLPHAVSRAALLTTLVGEP